MAAAASAQTASQFAAAPRPAPEPLRHIRCPSARRASPSTGRPQTISCPGCGRTARTSRKRPARNMPRRRLRRRNRLRPRFTSHRAAGLRAGPEPGPATGPHDALLRLREPGPDIQRPIPGQNQLPGMRADGDVQGAEEILTSARVDEATSGRGTTGRRRVSREADGRRRGLGWRRSRTRAAIEAIFEQDVWGRARREACRWPAPCPA